MKVLGERWQLLGDPVAIQGDPDCTIPSHDHRWIRGEMIPGCVRGYHCPRCGGDCPMTGHKCADGGSFSLFPLGGRR